MPFLVAAVLLFEVNPYRFDLGYETPPKNTRNISESYWYSILIHEYLYGIYSGISTPLIGGSWDRVP